jgi:four helix bundle protein
LEDLFAYQLAVEFKLEVYDVLKRHPRTQRDFRWLDQLTDAASGIESNIAEAWGRYGRREMQQYLKVSRSCLLEAKVRLIDGVHRGHYPLDALGPALRLWRRCWEALNRFMASLRRFDDADDPPRRGRRRQPRRPRPPSKPDRSRGP